jgi:Cellulase (glycosyl hydrolase family 5)
MFGGRPRLSQGVRAMTAAMKRIRSPRGGVLIVGALAVVLSLTASQRPPAALGAAPLSISVVGNHFVNGAGQTIRLLGVNREGTEYACTPSRDPNTATGYSVGPEDASDAAAIASWHVNAVRIPINEDCWLGINGLPIPDQGTAASYRQMIEDFVSALNADGIYAILDLQWNAPGSYPADGLRTMPDDHSPAFWTSVATTFLNNPAVLFDAFNEPHSVSWACWRDGGCTVPALKDGTTGADPSQTYTAVGMQSIVNAIRATGARQPILLAGLSHGNDLSGWLANMPTDPDGQLAASFHVYQPNSCSTTSCWDSTVAPVAAVVPMTTLEFSEQDCSESWDNSLMNWDDAHGIGYLGWGWFILTPHCQSLYLITDWNGTPASPNGTALHDHLAALWAAGDPSLNPSAQTGTPGAGSGGGASGASGGGATGTSSGPRGAVSPSSDVKPIWSKPGLHVQWIRLTRKTLAVRLKSSRSLGARLSARTAPAFSLAGWGSRWQPGIGLGARRFTLRAQTWRVITVTVPARAQRLIAGQSGVRAKVTITADAGENAITMVRTVAARRG